DGRPRWGEIAARWGWWRRWLIAAPVEDLDLGETDLRTGGVGGQHPHALRRDGREGDLVEVGPGRGRGLHLARHGHPRAAVPVLDGVGRRGAVGAAGRAAVPEVQPDLVEGLGRPEVDLVPVLAVRRATGTPE